MRKLMFILRVTFHEIQALSQSRKNQKKGVYLNRENRCLFVFSSGDLNSSKFGKMYPDKLIDLSEGMEQIGFSSLFALHPYKKRKFILRSSKRILFMERTFESILYILRMRMLGETNEILQDELTKKDSPFERISLLSLYLSISKIEPQIVISIGATQDLVTVCRVLRIPIAEMMHGVFTSDELPTYWTDNNQANIIKNHHPDLFLSWHEKYSELMREFGVTSETVGYPIAEFEAGEKSGTIRPLSFLISLSWGDKNSVDPCGAMSQNLFRQLNLLVSNEIKFVFRIHPVFSESLLKEWRLKKWLLRNFSGSVIQTPRKNSLSSSLRAHSLHITEESSTFFEAALLSIPTLITGTRILKSIPEDFIDNQMIISRTIKLNDLPSITKGHDLKSSFFFDEKRTAKMLRDLILSK